MATRLTEGAITTSRVTTKHLVSVGAVVVALLLVFSSVALESRIAMGALLGLFGLLGLSLIFAEARVAAYVLIALLPFQSVISHFVAFEPFATFWKEAVIAAAAITAIAHMLLSHNLGRFRQLLGSSLALPTLLYFSIIGGRFVLGPDYLAGMWGLYLYTSYFLLALVFVYFFRVNDVWLVLRFLSVCGGVVGALVVADAFFDLSSFQRNYALQWFIETGIRRPRFPFSSPLRASAFLSITGAITVYSIATRCVWGHHQRVAVLLFMATFAGLLATFSRGGWVGFAVAVGCFGLLQSYPAIRMPKPWISFSLGVVAVVAVAAAALLGVADFLLARLVSIADFSEPGNASRVLSWLYSIQRFGDAPLLGIGVGQTGPRAVAVARDGFVTESYVLQHLVELGVVGLLAFLILYGAIVSLGLRLIRELPASRSRDCAVLVTGVLCSLFAYSLYLQVLQVPVVSLLFWLLVGVLLIMSIEVELGNNAHRSRYQHSGLYGWLKGYPKLP